MSRILSGPFDAVISRRGTGSNKWSRYDEDVLPLWVADMDFAVPECVAQAVADRAAHKVYGYAAPPPELRSVLVEDLAARFDWHVSEEAIVFLPGVEPGISMALAAFLKAGDGVAQHTPAHRPLLRAPGFWHMRHVDLPLEWDGETWSTDTDLQRKALAQARALILCNPQNPTGKVFSRGELEELGEQAIAHDLLIISDEIHGDLLFDGRRHIPIAGLSPEIARRTITLMSPGKTFNTSGLKAAFAVIPDPDLRRRFDAHRMGMVDSVNAFGLVAMQAAYRDGGPWREGLLSYLQANRDWLAGAVREMLPGFAMHAPEATFLAWLDGRAAGIKGSPQRHFLDHARVALSAGEDFGEAGHGFVRLNFGAPRATLIEAITRMNRSLTQAG